MSSVNEKEGYFAYFAYGSNLSSIRIHLNNPSAVKIGIGKLQDYEMCTGLPNGMRGSWGGAPATIHPKGGTEVWGVVWKIDLTQMDNLDRQEALYKSTDVGIHMNDGSTMCCRTYVGQNFTPMKPSPAYKNTIIEGAVENGLPEEYVQKLRAMEDNGNHFIPEVVRQMEEARKNLMNS